MYAERELAAFKFVDTVSAQLRSVRDAQKALRHALRDVHVFFRAAHTGIAALQSGSPDARLLFSLPENWAWNLELLTQFIRDEHPLVRATCWWRRCSAAVAHGASLPSAVRASVRTRRTVGC